MKNKMYQKSPFAKIGKYQVTLALLEMNKKGVCSFPCYFADLMVSKGRTDPLFFFLKSFIRSH